MKRNSMYIHPDDEERFDPAQPRDEHGQWTDTGKSGGQMTIEEFNKKFHDLYNQFTKNEQYFYSKLKSWQFNALNEVANRMGSLAGTPSYNAISKAAHSETAKNITEPHARKWLDDVIDLIDNRPTGMPGDYTKQK